MTAPAATLAAPSALGRRATSAAVWTLGGLGAQFALRLGSNLLMTRLLVPEAYGMIAFATVFLTAMQLATDLGISKSIVRERDGADPHFLRVAWTVKIIRSLVVAAGVLLLAAVFSVFGPAIGGPGSVYRAPEMPLLIALVAVAPILDGLTSTNLDVLTRSLAYRRVVLLEVASRVMSIGAMVAFALVSPTVWALLCGMLVANLALCVMSHAVLPGASMRLRWDAEITARLWTFGKWVIGSSALTFVYRNADKFILGAALPAATFGLYTIAMIWIGIGQQVIDTVIGKVGFPAAAEVLRERPQQARQVLRHGIHLIDLACGALFVLLAGMGQTLVLTLYSEIYSGAGAIIVLLAPTVLALRFRMIGNAVLATGDSRSVFCVALIGAAATVAGMLIGLQFDGMRGALTGLVLGRLVPLPYLLGKSHRIFGTRQTIYDAGWIAVCAAAALWAFVAV